MPTSSPKKFKKFTPIIIILSIIIPLFVAFLYIMPKDANMQGQYSFLPKINAYINLITAIVLIRGFLAIRKGNIQLHKKLMLTAVSLSILFLLLYVTYHSVAESTSFGGEGVIRYIYYFLLLSHIILAAVIVPLVLITLVRGLSEKYDKHRKIARITLPIWLYVTISGVIVYYMISPYY